MTGVVAIVLAVFCLIILVFWSLFLGRVSSAACHVMSVLEHCKPSPVSARELREGVRWCGWGRMSVPVFYQMMARLEEDGHVRGFYVQAVLESGETVQRRYYVLGPAPYDYGSRD